MMRRKTLILILAGLLMVGICTQLDAQKEKKKPADGEKATAKTEQAAASTVLPIKPVQLVGEWALLSAKQNNIRRVLRFTSGKEFTMIENGKITMRFSYVLSEGVIYFTAKEKKTKFASIHSLRENILTLALANDGGKLLLQKL